MTVDRETLKDPSWWHWAATVPLLVAHVAGGVAWALPAAAGLCASMALGFFAVVRSWRPFPVQIRAGYVALLLLGTLPWMGWLHVVQICGTTAMIAIGYCPLARMLMLLPWNRSGRFSPAVVRHAFMESPTGGGLFRVILLGPAAAGASCSLKLSPGEPAAASSSLRVAPAKVG